MPLMDWGGFAPADYIWARLTGWTQHVGVGPEEGNKNDRRAGTPLLWRKAERVGAVQPGEEKAAGVT